MLALADFVQPENMGGLVHKTTCDNLTRVTRTFEKNRPINQKVAQTVSKPKMLNFKAQNIYI